jgi:hypothetical protein
VIAASTINLLLSPLTLNAELRNGDLSGDVRNVTRTGSPMWTSSGERLGMLAPSAAVCQLDDRGHVRDLAGQRSAGWRTHAGWRAPSTSARGNGKDGHGFACSGIIVLSDRGPTTAISASGTWLHAVPRNWATRRGCGNGRWRKSWSGSWSTTLVLSPEIGGVELTRIRPHIIFSADHRLAGKPVVALHDLTDEPMVLLQQSASPEHSLALCPL